MSIHLVSWESQLRSKEIVYYKNLFQIAFKSEPNILNGLEAVQFFANSGLPNKKLSEVWEIADKANVGYLTIDTFSIALKLIACAQNGITPVEPFLTTVTPLPKFHGLDIEKKSTSIPTLSTQERKKYQAIFQAQQPTAQGIPDEAAQNLFKKAKLSDNQLRQIRTLAYIRKSGYFDETEFIIAMHCIAKIMDKSITTTLPSIVPINVYLAAAGEHDNLNNDGAINSSFVRSPESIMAASPLLQDKSKSINVIGNMAFSPSPVHAFSNPTPAKAYRAAPPPPPQQQTSTITSHSSSSGPDQDLLGVFGNERLSDLTNSVNSLQNQITNTQKSTLNIQKQKESISQSLNVLHKKKMDLQSQVDQLEQTRKAEQANLDELKQQVTEKEPGWSAVQTELDMAEQQLQTVKDKIEQEKSDLKQGQQENEKLRRNIHNVQMETTRLTKELEELQRVTKKKAEAAAEKKRLEEEARLAAAEEERKRLEEEERKRVVEEEERIRLEEEERKRVEEERKRLEEEERKRVEEEEERKRLEEEEERKRLEEEERKRVEEEEERKRVEEEEERKRLEEEERKRLEEEERKRLEEEERKRLEEEERKRLEEEEELKRVEEEEERKRAEEEERKRAEEEDERKAEEEHKRLKEEEVARKAKEEILAAEAETKRKQLEEEAAAEVATQLREKQEKEALEAERLRLEKETTDLKKKQQDESEQEAKKEKEGSTIADTAAFAELGQKEDTEGKDFAEKESTNQHAPSTTTNDSQIPIAFAAAAAAAAASVVEKPTNGNTDKENNVAKQHDIKEDIHDLSDEEPLASSMNLNNSVTSSNTGTFTKDKDEDVVSSGDTESSTDDFFDAEEPALIPRSVPVSKSSTLSNNNNSNSDDIAVDEEYDAVVDDEDSNDNPKNEKSVTAASSNTDENEFVIIDHPENRLNSKSEPKTHQKPTETDSSSLTTNDQREFSKVAGDNSTNSASQSSPNSENDSVIKPDKTIAGIPDAHPVLEQQDQKKAVDSGEGSEQKQDTTLFDTIFGLANEDEPIMINSTSSLSTSNSLETSDPTTTTNLGSKQASVRAPPPPPPQSRSRSSILSPNNISDASPKGKKLPAPLPQQKAQEPQDFDALFGVPSFLPVTSSEGPVPMTTASEQHQEKEFESDGNDDDFETYFSDARFNNSTAAVTTDNQEQPKPNQEFNSSFPVTPIINNNNDDTKEKIANRDLAVVPSMTSPFEQSLDNAFGLSDNNSGSKVPVVTGFTDSFSRSNEHVSETEQPRHEPVSSHENEQPPVVASSAFETQNSAPTFASPSSQQQPTATSEHQSNVTKKIASSSVPPSTTNSSSNNTESLSAADKDDKKKKKKSIVSWAKNFGGFDFPSLDSSNKKKEKKEKKKEKKHAEQQGSSSSLSVSSSHAESSQSSQPQITEPKQRNVPLTTPSVPVSTTLANNFSNSGLNDNIVSSSVQQPTTAAGNHGHINYDVGTIQGSRIAELVNMGFDPVAAKRALDCYDQDVKKAANFLLDQA